MKKEIDELKKKIEEANAKALEDKAKAEEDAAKALAEKDIALAAQLTKDETNNTAITDIVISSKEVRPFMEEDEFKT